MAGQLKVYDFEGDLLPSYSNSAPQMSPIDMLKMAVPGTPGQDYPIFAEVPQTSFSCDGRVNGGYYVDVEAQCQVFISVQLNLKSFNLIKNRFSLSTFAPKTAEAVSPNIHFCVLMAPCFTKNISFATGGSMSTVPIRNLSIL